jgi:hypothetical protein
MLNNQQIDQFHRDGLLVLRAVFDGEELEGVTPSEDWAYDDPEDYSAPV